MPPAVWSDDFANAATTPVKAIIVGGIGTGKTTLLATARDSLLRAGIPVLTRPPRNDDPPRGGFRHR